MEAIPIIDLLPVVQPENDEADWAKVAAELRVALSKTGFALLVNHGVSQTKIEDFNKKSLDFFHSPKEVKEKYAKSKDQVSYHGYNSVLAKGENSYREYFHFWANNGKYPDEDIPDFRKTVTELITESNALCKKLFILLSKSLDLEDDYLLKWHKGIEDSSVGNHSYLASIYYPPLTQDVSLPQGKIRMGNHTDWDTFSLLFLDTIGGLEAKTVNGDWIPTNPVLSEDGSHSILLIVGDLLEKVSSGLYPATEHRVPVPSNELQKLSPRLSVPYFIIPDNDITVTPNVIENNESTTYSSPVKAGQYFETLCEQKFRETKKDSK